jgi:molybdopterin molybdotransferase
MIAVTEARSIIAAAVPEPRTERVALAAAAERLLAEEIAATFPMPRFTNAAMDGFAVRAADTRGATKERPVRLRLAGDIPAGQATERVLQPGECARCMTGAPLPPGADAVVMVEHTSGFASARRVEIYRAARPGQHVRRQGEEIRKGEPLLRPGSVLGPAEIGILATFGYGDVAVYRRPRVALLATGDELVEPGQPLAPGQIYNANRYLLADLVARAGGEVHLVETVRDDPAALDAFLERALNGGDVVISSGGVSMGKYDFVRPALFRHGVRERFWKVAQKPGKPLFFGTRDEVLFFGLPGNPVSLFITFMEYVRPVLRRWGGAAPEAKVTAILADEFPREKQKVRFLFGRTHREGDRLFCTPARKRGSHMLTAALEADCIIEVEPGPEPLPPGAEVRIGWLPWRGEP